MGTRYMSGWNKQGKTWTRKRGEQFAKVMLGKGGWNVYIYDGKRLTPLEGAFKRSRQARKYAQKQLAALPVGPIRLAMAA